MTISQDSDCAVQLWPGSVVKIKNTFLDVEIPEGYDELAVLQSCRRDVRSCPSKWTLIELERAEFECQEKSSNQASSSPGQLGHTCVTVSASNVSPASGQEFSCGRQGRRCGRHRSSSSIQNSMVHPEVHDTNAIRVEDTSKITHASCQIQRESTRNKRKGGDRLWCRIFLNPDMLDPNFALVPKLIGKSGCNTREIFEATGVHVRVRGKGSGHREMNNGKEAPVPLMVALGVEHCNPDGFVQAFLRTKKLLKNVSKRYSSFCWHQGREATKRECFWIGESSDKALDCLGPSALADVRVERPKAFPARSGRHR